MRNGIAWFWGKSPLGGINSKIIAVILLILGSILFAQPKSFADVASSETYTVTIPSSTIVMLKANTTTFGAILSSEFGTSVPSAHNIIVGNATGSDSYVQSNDASAGAKEYILEYKPNTGSTISIADGGTKAVLTLGNSTGKASVGINISNNAKNAYPKLGDTTPIAFTRVDTTKLHVASGSSVPFNSGTGKAPLDLVMDLDESTLSIADAAGAISFDLTFTVVGLN